MSIEQVDQTVVTQEPAVAADQAAPPLAPVQAPPPLSTPPIQTAAPALPVRDSVRTDSRRLTSTSPGAAEMTRRVVVLLFGLIQIVVVLRIVLLLLDARTGNALVSGILDVSKVFVAPFEGILNTNALSSGGSTLDTAAVLALVGWTILELIVVWAVGIFRREPASHLA